MKLISIALFVKAFFDESSCGDTNTGFFYRPMHHCSNWMNIQRYDEDDDNDWHILFLEANNLRLRINNSHFDYIVFRLYK